MGTPKGPFWETQKLFFLFFGDPKRLPPEGCSGPPLSEENGFSLEAVDIFFGNPQLGRPLGGGAWAPQKSPWEIILALFWGPKVGPSGVPKCEENEVG